jgi:SAM-dependent methyltransferase
MPANEDQLKFWNDKAGRDWTELQERMDANLAGIHDAILAFADPRSGEAVLDIGCGTGTTSMVLADRVGPSGRVTGIDLSQPMLELARRRGAARANLNFVLADASLHPFAPEHDLLFSRFGVMFFDDPVGAFTHLRGALKAGGRLAFVCWRTPPENPWASAPVRAARPFLPETPPPDPLAPGPFAFCDPERIQTILAQAGFSTPRIEPYDGVMNMGRNLDMAAAQTLRIGPLSRAIGDADAATRQKIVAAVKDAFRPFVISQGDVAPPTAGWLVEVKVA